MRILTRTLIGFGTVLGLVFTGHSAAGHPSALAARPARVNLKALFHNSWDPSYRKPFGAVPAGTPVTLRLRTAHAGATSASLYVVYQSGADLQAGHVGTGRFLPMKLGTRSSKYDTWQITYTPKDVGVHLYRFRVRNGSSTGWYSDTEAEFGGTGAAFSQVPDTYYHLTSYAPDFKEVSWARNAVIYQIFPDRFFNGDPSNDHSFRNGYGGTGPTLHTNWNDIPTGEFDFFGGDLQGIIDKLPYLKDLGVNTLYLNPIFLAPSNHKYDTSDYFTIDPLFGTLDTFKALVQAAHADGMHLILDGVFNHTGSDSIYFNEYASFPGMGAFQSQSSPWYGFYNFQSWPYAYDSFENVQTLPQLQENDAVKNFIFGGSDSVAQHWLALGSDGWRLDAAQLKSDQWWQGFRSAVKARFPDDILICECDLAPRDAIPWLLGNEMDGVMNYRWRQYVLEFFDRGGGVGSPASVVEFFKNMMSMLEEYPLPAIYSSMNLLDSHDTDRITSVMPTQPEQRVVAAFQMTWIGAPTIYYGDEAYLPGANSDPERRRPFPWGHPDTDLQAYYKLIIGIRYANPALRDGSISPLVLDNNNRVLAFLCRDSRQSVAAVFNDDTKAHTVSLKLSSIANGTRLEDAMAGNKTYTVKSHHVTLKLGPYTVAVLVQTLKSQAFG